MFDFEIAFYFYKLSRILEIFGGNKYKSAAYFSAGMAVDSYSCFIQEALEANSLKCIDGIGDSSIRIIKEIVETGRCAELERLEALHSIDDYSLVLSHGLGVKTIGKLFGNNIKTLTQLNDAVSTNSVIMQRFSMAERDKLYLFTTKMRSIRGRYLYSYISCLEKELLDILNANNEVPIACIKDSDWCEKPTGIALVCKKEAMPAVNGSLLNNSSRYHDVIFDNDSKLVCTTAFGIPVEIDFFDEIPPTSNAKKILRGDLHIHTKWSDGKHGIKEMAEFAVRLGREYIGITDHTYSLKIAKGLSEIDALRQIEEIRLLKTKGINILSGIEVEILSDGTLDFSDTVLSKFDYVIAAVHTNLQQPPYEMQTRMEKALSNPYVNILAHPTGKLTGRPGILFSEREPFSLPFENILDICVKNNVVLEFNCFPERFDVGVEHFPKIHKSGAFISVGTDSHSVAHLNCLQFAEVMFEKCPIPNRQIINTFTYKKLIDFFSKQRTKGRKEYESSRSDDEKRDFSYYFNSDSIDKKEAVVGIDLTGSESKPSGWAVLTGSYVITKAISSDDELIAESMKYNPKVVSIDSPLSYPEGRCCSDANCKCSKYGITRYCERLLSSFGIGVYPCLIPSMVNLTNRGLMLATKFRSKGVEVIESYPGVAQDVLSIRRKQSGIEHLKNSYSNFGIKGDYLNTAKVTHDELDAIASALVGLFYIKNRYVALGNNKEGYLIAPCVAPDATKPVVIGLTGEIGAGKTTLAEYLCFKHGFISTRYSAIIQRLYDCDDSRKTLQQVGNMISSDMNKQRELSMEIIRDIDANQNRHYVVDGLRHQIDYDVLSDHFGDRFTLLCIEASFKKRHQRYIKRNSVDFCEKEFEKITNDEAERGIKSLMMHCHVRDNVISNNKTFKAFFESAENKFKELLCQ